MPKNDDLLEAFRAATAPELNAEKPRDRVARMAAEVSGGDPAFVSFATRAAKQESAFKDDAVSPKGASGVMQIMPGTFKDMGGKNFADPVEKTQKGVEYLWKQYNDFGQNETLAAAAYNAGPGAVRKYGGVPPFAETQNYVAKIGGLDLDAVKRATGVDPRQFMAAKAGAGKVFGTYTPAEFDALPDGPEFKPQAPFQAPDPVEPRGTLGALKDYGLEAAGAAVGGVKTVADFIDPASGVSKALDTAVKWTHDNQSPEVKAEKAQYQRELDQAQGIGDEVMSTLRYAGRNPVLTAAQIAGNIAPVALGVGGVAKGAQAVGAGARAAELLARGAGIGLGAAMGGGDAAGSAYEKVMRTSDEVIMRNPAAVKLAEQGMPREQIKSALAQAAAGDAKLVPALLGGVFGAFGVEKWLAGGKSPGRLVGALIEGAQEAVEEGVTEREGNRAAQVYDPAIDVNKGVAAAATMGGIMGVGAGATFGGHSTREVQPQPSAGALTRAAGAGIAADPAGAAAPAAEKAMAEEERQAQAVDKAAGVAQSTADRLDAELERMAAAADDDLKAQKRHGQTREEAEQEPTRPQSRVTMDRSTGEPADGWQDRTRDAEPTQPELDQIEQATFNPIRPLLPDVSPKPQEAASTAPDAVSEPPAAPQENADTATAAARALSPDVLDAKRKRDAAQLLPKVDDAGTRPGNADAGMGPAVGAKVAQSDARPADAAHAAEPAGRADGDGDARDTTGVRVDADGPQRGVQDAAAGVRQPDGANELKQAQVVELNGKIKEYNDLVAKYKSAREAGNDRRAEVIAEMLAPLKAEIDAANHKRLAADMKDFRQAQRQESDRAATQRKDELDAAPIGTAAVPSEFNDQPNGPRWVKTGPDEWSAQGFREGDKRTTKEQADVGGYLLHEPKPGPDKPAAALQAPLSIEPLSDKAIIVKGDTKAHKDRIKDTGGRWNGKAGGWMFPKTQEGRVRKALADLLPAEGKEAARDAKQESSDQDGAWWKDATPWVRDYLLKKARLSHPNRTTWEHLKPDAREKLIAARNEAGNPPPQGASKAGAPQAEQAQSATTDEQSPTVDAAPAQAQNQPEATNVRAEPDQAPSAAEASPAEPQPGDAGQPVAPGAVAAVPEGAGQPAGGRVRKPRGTRASRKQESPQFGLLDDGAGAEPGQQDGVGASASSGDGISRPSPAGTDYRVAPDGISRTGSWQATAGRNLDIIELSKRIEEEARPATAEEQALLARYTGWGASEMRQGMFPVPQKWSVERDRLIYSNLAKPEWQALSERAEKLMTPAEQKEALSSTQYAHYTSPQVIQSIYATLERMGFPGGRILEPGMGNGLFAMLMPDAIYKRSTYTGVERDILTSRIAKLLLPQQNVIGGDFTRVKVPAGYFDAAIGNPPFANIQILDDPVYRKHRFSLHDYFFAKSIDAVRPGGLMVFVTSRYTMDKQSDKGRKYLAERADLLGAIRLPQTAFKQNAGTEVVTDVLFLQKREAGTEPAGQAWTGMGEVETPQGKALINEYFAAHPEMVLGQHAMEGSMYSKNEYTVLPNEGDIVEQFKAAAENLPAKVYKARARSAATSEQAAVTRDFNPKTKKEGGLYLNDAGDVLRVESGSGVPVSALGVSAKEAVVLKDMVGLKDAIKDAQLDQWNDGDWKASLKALNTRYDAFVKKHGQINAFTTFERTSVDADGNEKSTTFRRFKYTKLLRMDVEGAMLAALETISEDGSIHKAAILRDRTIAKPQAPQIKTTADALAVTLDQYGGLNLQAIAEAVGEPQEQVIAQLGDLIYEAPGAGWQLADEYLAGDVVQKLDEAIIAARTDKRYERNVKALEAAQPKPLGPDDVTVQLGAGWVGADTVQLFAKEVLGQRTTVKHNPNANTWEVAGSELRSTRGRASEWGNADRSPLEILEAILNNRTIKITKTDENKKTYTDDNSTAQVNDIAKKMRERFRSWVWTDAERAGQLLDDYNRKYNNLAPRKFDGAHLTLPGVSLLYKLYPHQKNVIWRAIQTGNVYAAHAVGAGKTMEMIGAGMEQKRLGLINKPMYVVPNHMLEQFANEFKQMYPAANVMVADDENFSKENRRRFVAQAALNAPDAIVITHSAMQKIALSPERNNAFIEEQMAFLDELLDEAEESNDRITRRRLENQRERMERRLRGKTETGGKDETIYFEQLGVDYLVVDEAHEYRKLDFYTNRTAKGISPEGSNMAMDLFMKVQYLEEQKPGRSHMFGSGTPVTNTMGELYTLMRFFDEKGMERDGIQSFDAWASQFGEVAAGFERNAAGSYEVVERFAKFVNVPELMSRVRSFMDVLTSAQLGDLVKRPAIKGGGVQNVVVPASEELDRYMKGQLATRIEQSRKWKPTQQEPNNPDPLIAIISDGRLSTIDARFFNRSLPNDPGSKLNKMIDEIIARHREFDTIEFSKDGKVEPLKGATQIVFAPVGFGDGVAASRGFSARDWIAKRLVEAGIPPAQIAWMSDLNSDAKKERAFADMRAGKIRILFGSPKNMGTGVNVQKRLKALHYLSPPWYPSDVEQPHGRILRQGNGNSEIELLWYATAGTYDSTMWSMVTRKAKFIEQALTGDSTVRKIEDISEASQYEMASALASGDERVMQLAGLSADIERLSRLREAHDADQQRLRADLRNGQSDIGFLTAKIKKLKAAEDGYRYVYGDDFAAKVGNTAFDNREAFGAALLEASDKAYYQAIVDGKSEAVVPLGEVNGHAVYMHVQNVSKDSANYEIMANMSGELSARVHFTNRPFGTTMSPQGMAQRVANTINSLDNELRANEDHLARVKESHKAVQARVGAPFAEAQELAEKIAEKASIEAALAAEGEAAKKAAEAAEAAKKAEKPAEGGEQAAASLGVDGEGMAPATVRALAEKLAAGWANPPGVVVHATLADAARAASVPSESAGRVEGFYLGGTVHLIADTLHSEADVSRVLAHEALGHYGLRGVFGKDLDGILRQITVVRRAEVEAKRVEYGLANTPDGRMVAAEEVLAVMAQATPQLGFVRRAVAAVRGFLRRMGLDLKVSDDEIIRDYILPARAFVTGRRPRDDKGRFKATGPAPVTVDPTLEAVFSGLEARGMKRERAQEEAAAHPLFEQIMHVHDNILDILQELEDSGRVAINCP